MLPGWQEVARGGLLLAKCHVPVFRHSPPPPPVASPLDVRLRFAALVPWACKVQVWAPVTGPTWYALATLSCALWGWHNGIAGGACSSMKGL